MLAPEVAQERVIAIDPGIRNLGIAEFDDGKLQRAALIRNPVKKGDDLTAAWAMSRAVREWLGVEVFISAVGVEIPRVYRAQFQKGDQNDLISLAMFAGVVLARIRVNNEHCQRVRLYPYEWKGQADADTVIPRRIMERLSPAEVEKIQPCPESLRHNVIDAIGIGLKMIGRFEPRRIYPL